MSDPSNLYLLTEAAERTGLTVDGLRKRIAKGKRERVKGNDGLVRVRLTTADKEALRLAEGQPDQPKPRRPDEVAELRERAARAKGEAAVLRERADKAEQRADRAEAAA